MNRKENMWQTWWILSLVNTWERWLLSQRHRHLKRKNWSTCVTNWKIIFLTNSSHSGWLLMGDFIDCKSTSWWVEQAAKRPTKQQSVRSRLVWLEGFTFAFPAKHGKWCDWPLGFQVVFAKIWLQIQKYSSLTPVIMPFTSLTKTIKHVCRSLTLKEQIYVLLVKVDTNRISSQWNRNACFRSWYYWVKKKTTTARNWKSPVCSAWCSS